MGTALTAFRYTKLIFDLDGVLYYDKSIPIPPALEVLGRLRQGAELMYLSNTSTIPPVQVARRLEKLGFPAREEEVVTSFALTLAFLRSQSPGARVFVIGTEPFRQAVAANRNPLVEPEEAELVVVGLDPELTYAELAQGLTALEKGAGLVACDLDRFYPTPRGLRPGAGATLGAFRGMGFTPDHVCGKPFREGMELAFRIRGFRPGPDCLLVGDQLETDILGAANLGIDSALVLTGLTRRPDLASSPVRPTYVLEDLSRLEAVVRGEREADG